MNAILQDDPDGLRGHIGGDRCRDGVELAAPLAPVGPMTVLAARDLGPCPDRGFGWRAVELTCSTPEGMHTLTRVLPTSAIERLPR